MDNSLPHLTTEQSYSRQPPKFKSNCVPVVSSLRAYATMIFSSSSARLCKARSFTATKSLAESLSKSGEWIDQFHYRFHLYLTRRIAGNWDTSYTAALYRDFAGTNWELAFRQAGFANITWIFPTESGFYQPILTAQSV